MVDDILSQANYPQTKCTCRTASKQTRPGCLEQGLTDRKDLALQVLDNVIMTRWRVLPREQCQGA